jgi:hypothetical protein
MNEDDFERICDLVNRTLQDSSVGTVRWIVEAGSIEEVDVLKLKNIADFKNVVEVDFVEKRAVTEQADS